MFGVWVIDVARNNELSLRHTATHCNTLQHTATHCNTLPHTATHCNTLQHTATHCNMLHVTMSHWCCTQQTSRCSWLLSSSHIFCIVIFHHIFYYGTPHIPGVYHHASYSATLRYNCSVFIVIMTKKIHCHIPPHITPWRRGVSFGALGAGLVGFKYARREAMIDEFAFDLVDSSPGMCLHVSVCWRGGGRERE